MLAVFQRIIAFLFEVSNEEGTPGIEGLNALYSREAQSFIHTNSQKKFTDVVKSVVIG